VSRGLGTMVRHNLPSHVPVFVAVAVVSVGHVLSALESQSCSLLVLSSSTMTHDGYCVWEVVVVWLFVCLLSSLGFSFLI
jgi:hypothetical protein